jgi:regulator-associated protein of mTOR
LTALSRFAFGHNKHLKSIVAAYWKPQPNSLLNYLPSLAHISRSSSSGYGNSNIVSSQIGSLSRVSNDNPSVVRDGRVSTSSPLATSGIMHGSPLFDDSYSGILNDGVVVNHSRSKPLDNAMYSQCVMAMCTLANDPSPHIATLGRQVLSIIGIEQVVAKPFKPTAASPTPLTGLARSSSWFEMRGGKFMRYLLLKFNILIFFFLALFLLF